MTRAWPAMGTMISVHVHDRVVDGRPVDETLVAEAIDEVRREIEAGESVLSTFRPDSDVSRINRGELHLLDADPMVVEVLDFCTWLEHESGGAFRAHPPEHPDRIDPAGFAKGWITERAATRLDEAGLADWYVGAGGDVVTRGRPAPDRPWRVGVVDPSDRSRTVLTLDVGGGAVATSGSYERGAHVWDGRDGSRVARVASITVTGPSLAWADAFATAAYAMGAEGLEWVTRFTGYQAIAVGLDGAISVSAGRRDG